MPLEEKKYDIEANNDWAKNVKGIHLYIDNAQSGRKAGYYCIGCDKQMDAVIRKKNPNHRSYFRHVPVDISKDETPCTFSNRKYREILATDILKRIKTIKVPNIYKYPPKGEDGAPMLLEKAKSITATKVKSQLTFYEDSEGVVKFGKNPNVEDRYLLIRPDVTFFDINDKPILLIELVITHKVSEEKKIKLRRLGIDTISIIVPKSSEQEIEDNFKTTKRVKWEYNGIEANTKYVRVSSGASEGVLEFDTDQRRIFEESIKCRKARLNNTLRTIKKCLQSESYRRVEQLFESEISRIESATKGERKRLGDMEAKFENEVYKHFKNQYDKIDSELKVVSEGRFSIKQESRGLETRYFDKTRELDIEDKALSKRIRSHSKHGAISEGLREEFRDKEIHEDNEIESIERETKYLPQEFERLRRKAESRFESNREELQTEQRDIESKLDNFGEFAKDKKRSLELEFRKLEEEALERINKRDSEGDSELSKGIRAVLNAGRLSHNYSERQDTFKRYKEYLELARARPWEK
jgi:hypothetical protein